jgi:SnoaL-like domain
MARIQFRQWSILAATGSLCAAIAAGLVMHMQPAGAAAQSSLEARVQRLEDEQAIRNLLVEYGHDLDTQDIVGYSKLFAKEGTWKGGIGSAQGPAGIQAMLQKALGKAPPYDPNKVRSFHLLTNFFIHVDGDRATARSKWTFFGRTEDNKLQPRLSGHYDDTFIREDGTWKFLSRVAPHDIPNPTEDGK